MAAALVLDHPLYPITPVSALSKLAWDMLWALNSHAGR